MMVVGLRTNSPSMRTQRHLNRTNKSLQGNIAKLSSGFRINSAADDAAGLAVSEEMTTDIRSLDQAERNAQDAVSLIQTAEGAMGETQGILQRMRELSVQANSAGITDAQRTHLDQEYQALRTEIDDIAADTQYNGNTLLDGAFTGDFQVGIESTDTVTVDLTATAFDSATLGLAGDITTQGNAVTEMAAIDTAIDTMSTERAKIGALQNRMDVKTENLSIHRENLDAARGRIKDVDIAREMASMTKNQILSQAGTAMLAQANSLPQGALQLLG